VGAVDDETPLNLTRGEVNEQEISTVLGDGLFSVCDAVDHDGDGVSRCAGDCDDADGSIHPGAAERCNGLDDDCDGATDESVPVPAGKPQLALAKSGPSVIVSWGAVVGATAYDAVRGSVGTLRSSAGDFTQATETCLSNDAQGTTVEDPTVPAPGAGSWHLVRAVNCGGAGSYDSGAPRQSGSRDAEIPSSPAACP
jgi:hypothetical protein